jgi:hypothetical protein
MVMKIMAGHSHGRIRHRIFLIVSVQVGLGGTDIAEALKSFNQIVQSVGTISSSTDEVSRAAEQQDASVEEISASVIEVSALVGGGKRSEQCCSNNGRSFRVDNG